jgi:restriction system protein
MKLPENSLFAVLMRARWWVSALLGLGVLGVARLFMPVGVAFFAALPFFVISAVTAWKGMRTLRGARLDAALAKLREMPWEDFSRSLESGFRSEGYAVTRLQGAADFELQKAGAVSLVCARRWKAARTGVEPLKELAAAATRRGAGECLHVATGEITENARTFAAQSKIRWLEGAELVALARHGGK